MPIQVKQPTQEELRRAAEKMVSTLKERVELLSGGTYRLRHKELVATFTAYLRHAIPLALSLQSWMLEPKVEASQKRAFLDALDLLPRILYPRLPPGNHALLALVDRWEGEQQGPAYPPVKIVRPQFLSETRFLEYAAVARAIIERLSGDSEAAMLAAVFLDSVQGSDDEVAIIQSLHISLWRQIRYLNQPRRRLDKTCVAKYLSVYLTLAGLFEKGVRILIGLKMCLDGKPPDYNELRRRTLGESVRLLKGWSETGPLAEAISVTARNALAHPPYHFNPAKKQVVLRDRRDELSWSYSEVVAETKNLCAGTLAVLGIGERFQYAIFQKIVSRFVTETSWVPSEELRRRLST